MSKPLKLYNTLTRSKEVFEPINREYVRLYVCGPTVYDYAHIGNARPLIVFDILYRLLRHRYGADHVVYARNITDVDDKINARAARDFSGLPLNDAIGEVTQTTERQFHQDAAALGCLAPNEEPHATGHIAEMVAIIERLVARGLAYVAEDNVLFSPAAMDRYPGVPRYGSLARRSLDEMIAGARVDVAPYKRDPMDFVLWKPSKPNEPGWPSPCGIAPLGRPGWHIECSAMSMAKLLTPFGGGLACDDPAMNIFDIHGGGIDLVFPHHENEIAQSCCAFDAPRMANVWMHNGFLQVEGEKMSKSLGNFITIHELLYTTKFGARWWTGDALRLAMLSAHYRQPIDWTCDGLESANAELLSWATTIRRYFPQQPSLDAIAGDVDEDVIDALSDDLNTPSAITSLRALFERARTDIGARNSFVQTARFLGFQNLNKSGRFRSGVIYNIDDSEKIPVEGSPQSNLIVQYRAASSNGIMSVADTMKAALGEFGLSVSENEAGISFVTDKPNMDAAANTVYLDGRVSARAAARAAKNWSESDLIRDELAKKNVAIEDNKDGSTTWGVKK